MNIRSIRLEVIHGPIQSQSCDHMVMESVLSEQGLRETFAQALSQAQEKKFRTLGFSDFGCTDTNFPLAGLAKIMIQEVMRFVRHYPSPSVEKIVYCLEDQTLYGLFNKAFCGYLRHIQDTLGPGPYVTVDVIIEMSRGIILIERSNPPYGWALPGGFIDYGESLEEAVAREAREETGLELLNLRQFHTYSRPDRDPRFQTVSTVFVAEGKGHPRAGDDAKNLKVVRYEDLLELDYAFDHKEIIKEYLVEKSLD